MIPCENCQELRNVIERLFERENTRKNTRKWVLAKAPLAEFLKLSTSIYLQLIDKFALLDMPDRHKEIATLAANLSKALYDELYKVKRKDKDDE